MTESFNKARAALDRAQRILLTTHERTDGDDLGSVLALAHHLKETGKTVTLAIKDGVPPSLRFLKGSEWVIENPGIMDYDLIVISGCSEIRRCGNPKIIESKIPKLNIDHHPDNQLYGDINVVDAKKSAVAELVYDFFKYCRWTITPAIASCLLTGIFTDTGSFMHSNTESSTLQAAAQLMKKGARIDTITKHTYKGKTPATLRAWGKALENAYYNEKEQIIYSIMTEDDLAQVGGIAAGAFEGLVETLNKVPEARFAIFLKQDGNVIKGSLRSDVHKGTNVSEIAHQFGGGGHKWASGFSVIGKLVKTEQGKWQVV
jgi:phosphoesterase RecJ-like protein